MIFERVLLYFVLFVLLCAVLFVFISGKDFKLPKSLLSNNKNRNNLLISISISLIITIIFIYIKENNL